MICHISGEFALASPLTFSQEDSGVGDNNVIYRGNGDAVIHGGKKVTGWTSVTGTPLYQAEVSGVDDFRQLYVDGNRAQRAKSKWLYYANEEYDDSTTNYSLDGYVLNEEDFPESFTKANDMEMVWYPSWRVVRAPVESIKTIDGKLVATLKPSFLSTNKNSSAPVTLDHPFCFENAPEFLDEPGEFYYNKETDVLTYYPHEYENMATAECFIPVSEGLIKISGDEGTKVKNIIFEGIQFKYGAWERPTESGFSTVQAEQVLATATEKASGIADKFIIPAQIQVDYAENIVFSDNEFSHLGSVAVAINNKSSDCTVEGNIFDDISSSAVTIGDWNLASNSSLDDYVKNTKISSNLIRRASVEYMTPVITGYYVNNTLVDHNDIKDAPYTGISMGWGWGNDLPYASGNDITNNKIENVLYKLKDGGHIYTLSKNDDGDISGNYLVKSGEWKGGVYLDNGSKNMTISNNVFDCFKWLKITWHNITGNTAANNWSDTPMAVKNTTTDENYKDVDLKTVNSLEEARGKEEGVWGSDAQAVINNAGLINKFEHLYTEYANRENLRNENLIMAPSVFGGDVIWAGDYMPGEGVGYYDKAGDNTTRRGVAGEPQIGESYSGTGALSIDATTQGEWTKHAFTVEEDGTYDIYANLGVNQNSVYAGISVDDATMQYVSVPKNSQNSAYDTRSDYLLGSFALRAGDHTVKIQHAVNNFWFYHLRIAQQGKVYDRADGFNSAIIDAIIGK